MPATATVCHCPRCLVADAGLGPGPYTPKEYAKLAPATVLSSCDDQAATDPQVKAAQLAVREAREAFEPFQDAWLAAVAAHRAAEMATAPDRQYPGRQAAGGLFTLAGGRHLRRTGELARKRRDAREEMELQWRKVIEANEALREATAAARIRAAEASRS